MIQGEWPKTKMMRHAIKSTKRLDVFLIGFLMLQNVIDLDLYNTGFRFGLSQTDAQNQVKTHLLLPKAAQHRPKLS